MKIIFFVENGRPSVEDFTSKATLESGGSKVFFSNGSMLWGFEDSCDAVVLSGDFPHIEKWAESKGIDILVEKKEEAKPKPKQARKPKAKPEDEPAD